MIKKLPSLSFVLILIFLFALPFQVWNSIVFPAQNGKILFGGWAGLILLVCWMLQYLSRKKESVISFSPVDAGIAGYTLFMLIHAVFIKPVGIDELYIIRMLSLIPVYLLIRIIPVKLNKYLFPVLLLTGIVQAVWGILQYRGVLPSYYGSYTASGTFFNPGPYAGYMAAVTPFAIAILMPDYAKNFTVKSTTIRRIVGIICLAVVVTALFISQSRSAWFAVLVSTGYLLLYAHRKRLRAKHFLLIVLTSITVIVLLYRLKKDSADGRLFIWNNTIEMIKDHPVTGVGVNAFQSHYMHYQAKWFQKHPGSDKGLLADNNIFAFNEPLKIVSEQGLPGLLITMFLLGLVFFCKTGSNKNQLLPTVAKAGIIGILAFGLFSYPFSILPIQIVLIVYMAVIASNQKPVVVFTPLKQKYFVIKVTTVCFAIVATLLFSHKLYDITTACKKWKVALKHFKPGRAENSLNLCRQIYPQLINTGSFISIYGAFLTHAGQYDKAMPVLTRSAYLQPTINTYLNLGDCYMNNNNFEDAEKAYKYALQMIPSRVKPVYKLATMYLFNNEECEAIQIIESYLNHEKKKRTIASYEIELELIEMKNELCN